MRVTEERKTFADESGENQFTIHRTINNSGVTARLDVIPCTPHVGLKFDNAFDLDEFIKELERAWLPTC